MFMVTVGAEGQRDRRSDEDHAHNDGGDGQIALGD